MRKPSTLIEIDCRDASNQIISVVVALSKIMIDYRHSILLSIKNLRSGGIGYHCRVIRVCHP